MCARVAMATGSVFSTMAVCLPCRPVPFQGCSTPVPVVRGRGPGLAGMSVHDMLCVLCGSSVWAWGVGALESLGRAFWGIGISGQPSIQATCHCNKRPCRVCCQQPGWMPAEVQHVCVYHGLLAQQCFHSFITCTAQCRWCGLFVQHGSIKREGALARLYSMLDMACRDFICQLASV